MEIEVYYDKGHKDVTPSQQMGRDSMLDMAVVYSNHEGVRMERRPRVTNMAR